MNHTSTIRKIISTHLLLDLDESFTNDVDLYAEGLDSMSIMQLIFHLENEMGVTIEAEDLGKESFQSVNAISLLMDKKKISHER